MIDLIASTLEKGQAIPQGELAAFKKDAFLAILNEEQDRLLADPALIRTIRKEVEAL